MDISTIVLYVLAIVGTVVSFLFNRSKTIIALKKALKMFNNIVIMLIPFFMIVGAMLAVITPDMIKNILGSDSGILGVFIAVIAGSIGFMPPFVTYPLGAELLSLGAGYTQVAALVTTLMGVGFVYIGIETEFFSKKATIYRNVMAIFASFIVALVVEVLM